jgi:hypothetical protein
MKDDFDFNDNDIKIKIAQFGGCLILSNGSRLKSIHAGELPLIKEKFGLNKQAKLQKDMNQSQLLELWMSW